MYKHDDEKCERELINYETVNVLEPDESEEFANKTFQNPSQFDKSDEKFQCDWCDLISERKSIMEKHQELSKIWCSLCSDSWGCEDNLRSHIEMEHQHQYRH